MPKTPRRGRSKSYRVSRILKDGTVREYTYQRKPPKKRGPAYTPDAVAAIIDQWQRSPEWKRLAPKSADRYNYGLRWLDEFRRTPIQNIRRRHMLAVRDGIADKHGNGAANAFIAAVSALMGFAAEREYIDASPLHRVRRLPLGEWRRWPEPAIEHALSTFPAHLHRAVLLALHTGQRSGDCVRMRWDDYDGEGINVVQQKTGAKLWIPCPADLSAALAGWPRTAVTILTDTRGMPWQPRSFQSAIFKEIHRHPELTGLQFHGLRKSAAARLAEAGCTEREIVAITGHSSAAQVDLYTKEANQRQLASAAIFKLDSAKGRKRG